MLFESQLDPDAALFNVPLAMRLVGPLDTGALEQALDGLVQRHEALRTTIEMNGGDATQRVEPIHRVELAVCDLTTLPGDDREAQMRRRLVEEARRPIDVSRLPLMRVNLFRLGETEHILLFVFHHIITDGWSESVLVNELSALYDAAVRGHSLSLPALPIGYSDYATWQRERVLGDVCASQLAYWKRKLEGAPPSLDLALGRASPTIAAAAGAKESIDLPKALVDALTRFAQQTQSTLFMTFLAAFKALLHRYTGSDDIVVGSAISGRTEPETQMLVGCFINILALRTDLSGDPIFRELVGRVRQTSLEAYAHQDVPFEAVVAGLRPERKVGRQPVVQIAFIFEPPIPAFAPTTLATEWLDVDSGISVFDLTILVEHRSTGMRATAEYRTELFDATAIARMLAHWRILLEGAVSDPERRLSELPLLTEVERRQLLVEWNDTAAEFPADQCIHQLFEAQVARTPEAVAVVFGAQRLTYAELNARANRLAHHLQTLGVGPEVLVGLCLERSLELVVGMLGILKAGGAFVPLDPNYPAARLAFMLQDTEVPALLTQEHLLARLPEYAGRRICLDCDWETIAKQPGTDPVCATTAESLAYVIYTSGSTGRPKGVMIEQRALVNCIEWMRKAFEFDHRDSVLQKTPVSFDAAMWEFFVPLIVGGRLVMAPRDAHRDPAQIIHVLREHEVTTVQIVPSLLQLLAQESELAACRTLTRMFSGGEALPGDTAQRFLERSGARLYNLYGPTEACINAMSWECRRDAGCTSVPIGRPIANVRVYVLDGARQPVPVGVAGELYIGGHGLARGYWKRPELTAESFVPDPHAERPGARMYRSGDRARYLPDGTVEFLGRHDQQVKLRGHRIEPGEIEAALLRHAKVREVLVVRREDAAGDPRLVAYVVTSGEVISATALRESIKERLPDYMLPSAFVMLNEMPRMPNGKVDRNRLPAPDATNLVGDAAQRVEQHDAIEVQLIHIWADLLGRYPLGVADDVFELGGHSLLALRLVDRVNRLFNRDLPVHVLWHAGRTIEGLASVLRDRSGCSQPIWGHAVPIKPSGSRQPLFCTPVIGGHLYYYENLARRLDPEQPVYGLPAQGTDSRESADTTIEVMAAHGIRLMREVQPAGPYSLLGFCSAGVVAFEMARQLEALGESVALLALADSMPPGKYFRLWREMLPAALMGQDLRLLQERIYHLALHPLGLERLRDLKRLGEAHRWALMGYKPGPFGGRALLIRTSDGLNSRDPAFGWGKFLRGGVDVRTLTCRHDEMFAAKTVTQLAAELGR